MGVLILITKPARGNVEPQTLTEDERCVPRPARATVERALTEKAKARPKTTRGARTPTPTPGSDKCAVVCRHRRLHALCCGSGSRGGEGLTL